MFGRARQIVSRAKKQILALLGERIEVRAKCREVRNSVESAMYEAVVIMQFPDAAPQPCPRPAKRGEGDHRLRRFHVSPQPAFISEAKSSSTSRERIEQFTSNRNTETALVYRIAVPRRALTRHYQCAKVLVLCSAGCSGNIVLRSLIGGVQHSR